MDIVIGQSGKVSFLGKYCLTRGKKSRTSSSLFNEFAAALQFPYYFGENWNAFDDLITDLDWLNCTSFFLIVFDSEQLLIDEEDDFEVLMQILKDARSERTLSLQSIDDAAVQKDLPFFVVLQCLKNSKEGFIKRLEAVGAKYSGQ